MLKKIGRFFFLKKWAILFAVVLQWKKQPRVYTTYKANIAHFEPRCFCKRDEYCLRPGKFEQRCSHSIYTACCGLGRPTQPRSYFLFPYGQNACILSTRTRCLAVVKVTWSYRHCKTFWAWEREKTKKKKYKKLANRKEKITWLFQLPVGWALVQYLSSLLQGELCKRHNSFMIEMRNWND